MSRPVCAIVGIGPGNGVALARRFAAEGYATALCSRNQARIAALADELPESAPFVYDASDPDQAARVFGGIEKTLGPVDTLIYNAGGGAFLSLDDTDVDEMKRAWSVNTLGLFAATKAVLPQMRAQGHGNIMVIGATASLRGGAKSAPFASAKASQRSLAQSMARHLGPEKIHVGYVIVDGIIDIPSTRKMMPDHPDEAFLKPDAIADSVFALCRQDALGWTFELDLRPDREAW